MKAMAIAISILAAVSTTASAQSFSNQGSVSAGQPGAKDRVHQVAPQATSDPQIFLYRASGVQSTGANDTTGAATVFFCTNHGNVDETLRIRVFDYNATVRGDQTVTISGKRTLVMSTKNTNFGEDYFLTPGVSIDGGHAVILGTTASIGCSIVVVDAANPLIGFPLHLTRYNPLAGSTE